MAIKTFKCDPKVVILNTMTAVGGTALEAITKPQEGPEGKPETAKRLTTSANGQKVICRAKVPTAMKEMLEAGGKVVGARLWVNGENKSASGKDMKVAFIEPTLGTTPAEPEMVKTTQMWGPLIGGPVVSQAEAEAHLNTVTKIEEQDLEVERMTAKELWVFEIYLAVEVEEPSETVGKLIATIQVKTVEKAAAQAPGSFAAKITSSDAIKAAAQAAGELRGRITTGAVLQAAAQAPGALVAKLSATTVAKAASQAAGQLRAKLPVNFTLKGLLQAPGEALALIATVKASIAVKGAVQAPGQLKGKVTTATAVKASAQASGGLAAKLAAGGALKAAAEGRGVLTARLTVAIAAKAVLAGGKGALRAGVKAAVGLVGRLVQVAGLDAMYAKDEPEPGLHAKPLDSVGLFAVVADAQGLYARPAADTELFVLNTDEAELHAEVTDTGAIG